MQSQENQSLMPLRDIARLLLTANISAVSEKTGVQRHILAKIRDGKLTDKTSIGVIQKLTTHFRT